MKVKIYRLIYLADLNPVQAFYNTELLDEQGFRKRFIEAVNEEQICTDTITENFGLSMDADWNTLSTGDMVDIFDADGYMVDVVEVDVAELNKEA